jgi:ribosomal protein S18 acetylase RimI-like enzyme
MPVPDVVVQPWTSRDRLGDIMALVHAAFSGFEPPSSVLQETAGDLAARQRDGVIVVAIASDEFVGSVFCAVKGDALYLTRMATHPQWRRRGVGAALMRAAEREARARGLPKLLLRVRKTLPGNRAYFAKFGFVVTGEGQEDGRTPFDVMEKVF